MFDKNYKKEQIFGLFFGFVLIVIYLFQLLSSSNNNLIVLFISILFFLISFFSPSVFKYPNIYWIKFGYFLGKVISPIILFLIYFFTIFPINLIVVRIFRKDILSVKFSNKVKSYWITKNKSNINMDNQF